MVPTKPDSKLPEALWKKFKKSHLRDKLSREEFSQFLLNRQESYSGQLEEGKTGVNWWPALR